MEKIKRYWLIGLLALIAVSMGITKIRYRNVDWEAMVSQTTPTVIPTSGPKIDDDYPLWELLPYTGKDFVVDRYAEPKVLAIKINAIKDIDLEVVKNDVYMWLLENKIATESHQLIFEKTL